MITVPSLDPCTDILDTDEIMITHQNGTTDTISGANFNKRTQIISASSKTITGTPLKPNNVVRVFFTADITGSDTTTALALTYNGTSKNVKVPKDGSLVNFTAQNMGGSPVVYKYCQAYTELELYYDGTQFVIVGNPVVISDNYNFYYANGKKQIEKYISPRNIRLSTAGSNKLFKLGTLLATSDGRAGFNFDISYLRVDTMGRILGNVIADNNAAKYLGLTPAYYPIAIKKTVITAAREYNIYISIAAFTTIVNILIDSELNFVPDVKEVSEMTGTEISESIVLINNL